MTLLEATCESDINALNLLKRLVSSDASRTKPFLDVLVDRLLSDKHVGTVREFPTWSYFLLPCTNLLVCVLYSHFISSRKSSRTRCLHRLTISELSTY